MTTPLGGTKFASFILRLGLAFIFAYAGVASLLQPVVWTGYLPGFMASLANPVLLVQIIAIYECLLALWLLSGAYLFYAACLSALTLLGITLANLNFLIVTFRDIGLIGAALALAALAKPGKR